MLVNTLVPNFSSCFCPEEEDGEEYLIICNYIMFTVYIMFLQACSFSLSMATSTVWNTHQMSRKSFCTRSQMNQMFRNIRANNCYKTSSGDGVKTLNCHNIYLTPIVFYHSSRKAHYTETITLVLINKKV